ncbi:hypothetical protein JOB18_025161 [Solea senegalensis]|uniref:Uncharacterized protein n=1 Tax=Solea senegalensis TaxID=28829 RepID=A0AAV6SKA3_SOLSE|nr:hypothetical protein JOB18_025161 [Solea senegalensis]
MTPLHFVYAGKDSDATRLHFVYEEKTGRHATSLCFTPEKTLDATLWTPRDFHFVYAGKTLDATRLPLCLRRKDSDATRLHFVYEEKTRRHVTHFAYGKTLTPRDFTCLRKDLTPRDSCLTKRPTRTHFVYAGKDSDATPRTTLLYTGKDSDATDSHFVYAEKTLNETSLCLRRKDLTTRFDRKDSDATTHFTRKDFDAAT